MKRILAVSVAFILIFSLYACKGNTPSDSDVDSDPEATTEISDTEGTGEGTEETGSTSENQAGDGQSGTTKPNSNGTSNNNNNNKTTTTRKGETTKTTGRKLADDKVVDMGGYTFTFGSAWMPAQMSKNATLLERLFFQRKEEVEKQYNCKIKIISIYADTATIKPLIMAKKKVADVIEMMPSMILPNAMAGYIAPLSDIKGIDPNDARWVEAYTKIGTFGGKVWGLQFTRPPEVRGGIYFNKNLLKANGINPDTLYTLVENKQWTFDKLREFAVATTKDTNKDGKIDTYGIVGDPASLGTFLIAANGGRMVTLNNGKATATFNSQPVLNAINFIDRLVNTDKVFYTVNEMWSQDTWNSHNTDYTKIFTDGKAAFYITESWVGNQRLKPTIKNFDYGFLPLPIGPNASDYVSPAGNARLCTITSTAAASSDIEKTVTIFNALARPIKGYEGEDWWLDEIQADYFQSNDKKSVNMYKLALDKSMVDLGYGVQQLNFDVLHIAVFDTVFWKNQTPSAALKGMEGEYDDAINAVYNKK